MFKKTKSKVLVDYASEEDDMSWHYHHSYKEAKVKKIMSKKDRREKKMFSSKDDERFLLTGEKLADRKSHKKIKDEEKEKEKKDKPEKANCFWESVTMTMRQISPAKKLEKIEGWEPPHLENFAETAPDEAPVGKSQNGDVAESSPSSLSIPATALELPSWCGRGQEEDSSRYANLLDSNDSTAAVKWTARAKVKLAGISRMSRGIVSESASVWEG
uniref:Si:ch211-225h24.2 n=2 Tax=Haplochromini TaxID=319058 RepID=A0A3Q2VCR0_HAPBU